MTIAIRTDAQQQRGYIYAAGTTQDGGRSVDAS